MKIRKGNKHNIGAVLFLTTASTSIFAHDPNFGIGPHVLFKNGIETALETQINQSAAQNTNIIGYQMTYGITGNWSAGATLPYSERKNDTQISTGMSDIKLFTKYRFWRLDSLGVQESAAIMFAANLNNGDSTTKPPLGNGANDLVTGLTYGYESIKWYRWSSIRYRYNGENNAGRRLGNKTLIDFVAGWRPVTPEYKKPDTVWLLELNTEITENNTINGNKVATSGGVESFITPGIFWTYRNFAIKSGLQLPVYRNLNNAQNKSNFRLKTTFEWHM